VWSVLSISLLRACEIEQANLKQNQVKMKQLYDKDAMIRKFKSGEKVIVLLFIRCNLKHSTQSKIPITVFSQSHFSFKRDLPQSVQKPVQKDYNVEMHDRLPLQQTVACGPHHPYLVDCLNKMCSSYYLRSGEIFPQLLETQGDMH
jgi:hypothetical protein